MPQNDLVQETIIITGVKSSELVRTENLNSAMQASTWYNTTYNDGDNVAYDAICSFMAVCWLTASDDVMNR